MNVRPATARDHAAIRRINAAAFPTPAEADLVDRLRADGDLLIELVAERDGGLVGCIQFSPLRLEGDTPVLAAVPAAALAPMAVSPEAQRQGVGAALIQAGVQACRHRDVPAIVVLGHPDYYPRFGFSAETARHIHDPFDAGPAFMAMSLEPGVLDRPLTPRYAPAFGL